MDKDGLLSDSPSSLLSESKLQTNANGIEEQGEPSAPQEGSAAKDEPAPMSDHLDEDGLNEQTSKVDSTM